MFKPQRPTTTIRDRERVEIKFSNFQALQVPKTWDRLFISILSVETGKTIAKLGKALVKNGNCLWTETVSESAYVTRDDSSKGYEECLLKLVVSTGSARSSALGEAIINVAQYVVGSRVSSSTVSQALKKCSYGTTLQFKVQCTVPRSRNRLDGDDDDDNGSKSKYSDSSDRHRSEKQEISNSEYEAENDSFHSVGNSVERDNESFSRKSIKCEDYSNSYGRRQQGSFEASPVHHNGSVDDDCDQSSSHSLSYQREDSLRKKRSAKRSSANNNENSGSSSRNLLEAAEDTIEELRAEAKMWERNARKLMIDLDMSKRDLQNVSKKHADLEMELKASYAENEGIRREVEGLKRDLLEKIEEDPIVQSDSMIQMQKVWESEVKYQQDLNASLSRQLRSSQESNVELVSVLQELEQTIEQQKIEIQSLSLLKTEFKELETSIARDSEENDRLLAQFEQLQESEKKLRTDYQFLENERKLHSEILSSAEDDYRHKLSVKEEEILRLEAKLKGDHGTDVDPTREIDSLREKIDELERDCAELTDENLELILKLKDFKNTDTSSNEHPAISSSNESELSDPKFFFQLGGETKEEVSDEVMQRSESDSSEHIHEIIKELRMAFHLVRKPWITATSDESVVSDDNFHYVNSESDRNTRSKTSIEYVLTSLLELNKLLETRISHYDKLVQDNKIEVEERNKIIDKIQKEMEDRVLGIRECERTNAEVQERYEDLLEEMDQKKSQLVQMETSLVSKEEELGILAKNHHELEIEVFELRQNSVHLEKNTELERKSNELENVLSVLQEENVQLQATISGLESNVRELKQENDICAKETEHFKNVATSLEEEIHNLKIEMESQILDLQQKTEDMSKQCLGAQEHCKHLELENKKLQESAASFEQETEDLRSLNYKLNQENEELQKHQISLSNQLIESTRHLTDCCKKIETLEGHLTMLREEFAESERRFQSEVDAVVQQNSKHVEKLALDESLQRAFSVKEGEIETLQKELTRLNKQISEAAEYKERISIEYSGDVSRLTAEKQALEASLQEIQAKAEIELQESELKVQDLNKQLVSTSQNHVELIADHERVLKMLAHYKRSEEKHKTAQNDLELKITICDYERQQLTKEIGIVKEQLQNIPSLKDQISLLKSELEGCMLEKKRLDLALRKMSEAHELMKAENVSFSGKISSLHSIVDELEECKRQNTAFKEELHIMENELAKKAILSAENADLLKLIYRFLILILH